MALQGVPASIADWVAELAQIERARPSLSADILARGRILARYGHSSLAMDALNIAMHAQVEATQHFYVAAKAELLRRANLRDDLTGGLNARGFEDGVRRMLAPIAFRTEGGIGAVFVDLRGFKAINDTQGHAFGDDVLTETHQRLATTMRPTDVVARLGGNRFVIAFSDGADPAAQADGVIARINAALDAPVITERGRIDRVEASFGVAALTHPGVPNERERIPEILGAFADAAIALRDHAQRDLLERRGLGADEIDRVMGELPRRAPRGAETRAAEWAAELTARNDVPHSVSARLAALTERAASVGGTPHAYRLRPLAEAARTNAAQRRDIELEARALEDSARHDPLTGFYNAEGFREHVHNVLVPYAAREQLTVVTFYADLSKIGQLVAQHGNRAVDQLMRDAHERIDAVIPSPGVVARENERGDEFLIADAVRDRGVIPLIEQRVRDALADELVIDTPSGTVSISLAVKIGHTTIAPPPRERAHHPAEVGAFARRVLDPANKQAAEQQWAISAHRQGQHTGRHLRVVGD